MESIFASPSIVEVKEVSFSYNSRPVVVAVSFSVPRGLITMLLGPSGSGKTTLLKLIKGLLKPERGGILWEIDPVKEIAYIPQGLGLVRNMTVLENVLVGTLGRLGTLPSLLKAFPTKEKHRAKELLLRLGLEGKEGNKAFHLSGGERQRVAIARALMQNPKLILADEFISQLDLVRTLEIMELVKQISQDGVTFLITTHDVELVRRYGHQAIFIKEGRKVEEVPAFQVSEELLTNLMQKV